MSFDWQTEDRDWDEREPPRHKGRPADLPPLDERLFAGLEPTAAPDATGTRNWRRRLAFLGVAGFLAIAVAGVVYWQVARRTTAAQERITAEVTASQAILLEAVRANDAELFVSFLSGRDREWAQAQERLVRDGGFLGRSAFDLTWDPLARPVTPTVTLAPDLLSAELIAPNRYVLDVGNGVMESVTLMQTAVFRQGPDRWLFSPPTAAFWGEDGAAGSRYVRLRYPGRDAAIAERLARDLDATLAEFCRNVSEACVEQGQLELTLSTDPASLAAYADPRAAWAGGSALVLPAPTLFGRPVDEAGYRALSRAYAGRVVSAAAANLSGWACCDDALFYGALRDALLHRLGLQAWSVGPDDYEWLIDHPDLVSGVARMWGSNGAGATADERRAVYALVDFLTRRDSSVSIVEMQQLLINDLNTPYWDWLSQVTRGAYGSQADFERDLLRYAAERVAADPLSLQ